MKKVLISGIQSSGQLHFGNYFGAIRQNVELGNGGECESYIFIADYHSLTTLTNPDERRASTFDIACAYLACGLDTNKVALFRQSDVAEHTELAWILNTVTPIPMLNLAHAYKDKAQDSEKALKDVNAGLFTYPVLMAADILMYGATVVPVGRDQEQHIEIAREIAGKYNRHYGKEGEFEFPMPKALVLKDVATVPGIDGQKMSKSKGNVIPLFGTDADLKKRVMSIVTDSARPEDSKDADSNIIYQIHSLFLDEEGKKSLRAKFEKASVDTPYGYKEAKEELLATIISFISPMRERYEYYQSHPEEVNAVLEVGREKALKKARETMSIVKRQVGLV